MHSVLNFWMSCKNQQKNAFIKKQLANGVANMASMANVTNVANPKANYRPRWIGPKK